MICEQAETPRLGPACVFVLVSLHRLSCSTATHLGSCARSPRKQPSGRCPRDDLPSTSPITSVCNCCCSCQDESIDELAAFLGVGEQVAALTAK